MCRCYNSTALSLPGNSGRLASDKPQEQRYPILSVCAVFSCVQTMDWLPVFGIFNVHTDDDTCDCTRVLYGHRKRVCTGSLPWDKNPLPYRGSNPSQYFAWLFSRPEALPTELSRSLQRFFLSFFLPLYCPLWENINCQ